MSHDLTKTSGLVTAIITVMALCAGGLCHLATVCTSFVFINVATHGRSMVVPEGWREESPEYVLLGTCLAARSAIIAILCWSLGGVWILEQPSSSCMTYLNSWQVAIKFFVKKMEEGWPNADAGVLRNSIYMAAFRGPTLKPTALFSCQSLESLMNMPVPPAEQRPAAAAPVSHVYCGLSMRNFFYVVPNEKGHIYVFAFYTSVISNGAWLRYYDSLGRKRVCGGAGLKATQLYTPEFGRGLAHWWSSNAPMSAGTAVGWFPETA